MSATSIVTLLAGGLSWKGYNNQGTLDNVSYGMIAWNSIFEEFLQLPGILSSLSYVSHFLFPTEAFLQSKLVTSTI